MSPATIEKQRRFLEVYKQGPTIARAARLAGVHRASVYRWRQDAAFAQAMQVAAEVFFRECRQKALAGR